MFERPSMGGELQVAEEHFRGETGSISEFGGDTVWKDSRPGVSASAGATLIQFPNALGASARPFEP